ncbi:MAG TPA: hypothetical protein VKU37_02050 [Verrucomicrobiae bacterium]|nr:hypothetical protein [Verrucomicrobiae bacterium]
MNCPVNFRQLKMGLYLSAPPAEETHWVQCHGRRCLAIVDKNGKWKCFATGQELIDVVKVPAT